MIQIHSWPSVILHLDGDAFFASVVQSANPHLLGKAIVTGQERGVATSISYEAKKYNIPRAMPIFEVKKKYPQVIVVETDYELISLFSQKMLTILREFSPTVEEYSVDEAFVDLKGLRKPLNMSYREIGEAIKNKVESSLHITVSVGISLTKTLAKVASSYRRPSGLTLISGRYIDQYLAQTKIQNVWGIGDVTASYLQKLGIKTALDFAKKPEEFVMQKLTKPFFDIWKELRGEKVHELDPHDKTTYQSITRSHTFTPPSNNPDILWAHVLSHVERAFKTAREFNYEVGKVRIFLKTQKFFFHAIEIKFVPPATYPLLIRKQLKEAFEKIYKKGVLYRTAGCVVSGLKEVGLKQGTLFQEGLPEEKVRKFYPLLEKGKIKFGTALYK